MPKMRVMNGKALEEGRCERKRDRNVVSSTPAEKMRVTAAASSSRRRLPQAPQGRRSVSFLTSTARRPWCPWKAAATAPNHHNLDLNPIAVR
jgi:hypothetical protein